MGVSVSINTSHISYNKTYTVTYECTYTPFDISIGIKVPVSDGTVQWTLKDLATGLTTTYGSMNFSLSAAEVSALMEAHGYPPGSHQISGMQINVKPQDIDEILNGNYAETEWITVDQPISHVGAPSAPQVSAQVSRDAVTLNWGAGSAGINNAVTGYDVQYADSTDGASWGSWTSASGSPASGTSLTVLPPDAVGSYRKFRVRTRGSAGTDWYSGWVESTNTLRRKWNAFAGWTDPTLVARSTKIRSVHLTQLQERINTIRAFYGLGHAIFSVITPRATRIAWATHIQEIRAAIDGVTTSHEAWNVLYSGKPRIDNITQLRRIIDNM